MYMKHPQLKLQDPWNLFPFTTHVSYQTSLNLKPFTSPTFSLNYGAGSICLQCPHQCRMTRAFMLTQLLAGCNMTPSTVIWYMLLCVSEKPVDSWSNAFAWHLCTEERDTTSSTNTSWRISFSAVSMERDSSGCMQHEFAPKEKSSTRLLRQKNWLVLSESPGTKQMSLLMEGQTFAQLLPLHARTSGKLSANLGVKRVNDGQLLHRAEAWGHGSWYS